MNQEGSHRESSLFESSQLMTRGKVRLRKHFVLFFFELREMCCGLLRRSPSLNQCPPRGFSHPFVQLNNVIRFQDQKTLMINYK